MAGNRPPVARFQLLVSNSRFPVPEIVTQDWQLVTDNSPSHVFEELFDLVDELRHSLWVEVVVCRL